MTTRRPIQEPPFGLPVLTPDGMMEPEWQRWMTELWAVLRVTRVLDVDIDPGTVGANTTKEVTATLQGLTTGTAVTVAKPTHSVGLGIVNARVSAKDTLAVTFMNTTAAGISPGSETYRVLAIDQ